MGDLVRFPLELAGVPGYRRHEKHGLIPQRFSLRFPSTCGRDCAHQRCLVTRRQGTVPCSKCRRIVQEGDYVHVLEVRDGFVVEQIHAVCPLVVA